MPGGPLLVYQSELQQARLWARTRGRSRGLLFAVVNGSLLTWAVYREGQAAARLARDIDLALEPYLPASLLR